MPVVNGGTIQAGPAWTGEGAVPTCAMDTIQYQAQLVKWEYSLSDVILYFPDFKPTFLQPPSTNENDLDPLMDASGCESCDVQEARNETPALPERLDEPELGSLAALTQQVDRVTHTEQTASSSGKK